jgi:hypothetical protein
MAHIEAPQDCSLDLSATLAANFVEIGVIPKICHGARESSIAIKKRWSVSDWSPSVSLKLGIECEVNPDVFAAKI